ncbi:MAG: AmmeMemoRadiSam system protein B [Candidatus Gracilibacteria bacterium]
MSIRKPAVANQFYPGNPQMLKQSIMEYLEKAKPGSFNGKLKAIIVPHAGYIYSGWTAAYAYKLLRRLDQERVWKVLLLGPAHNVPFYGAAAPEEDQWETPLGLVEIKDVRTELKESEEIIDVPQSNTYEHSLEVQVPFLQMALKNFVLYPLVLGTLRPKSLASEIESFVQQKDVIMVVSSDLSHFMKYADAKKTDLETSTAICDLDVMKMAEVGDACGRMGILTAMDIAKELGWRCEMLNYKNSGDTAGDMKSVVGYGAYAFYQ